MTNLLGTHISHYRFIDFLGQGGMGQVYVGYDEKLDRKVALKSLRDDHRLQPQAKARFLREARMLSQLAHPNICQIYDYIEGDAADFLVLELILGQQLTAAISRGIDDRHKLRIAEQIAGVLVAAHEKGIIHRDLKPDNIMLAEGCQVKVLDFGLSRSRYNEVTLTRDGEPAGDSPRVDSAKAPFPETMTFDPSDNLTMKGTIMGTVGYMSPEQARGEEVSPAGDMYSFGLILQELFTGKSPYDLTQDSVLKLEKVKAGETLPVEGIDPDLAALIGRLKSLAPAARPSAVDAAERLAWIRNKPVRRRKKILVAAAMGILALFGAAMTVQTIRATRAEKTAKDEAAISKRVSEFLVSIFQVSDPSEARGNTVTAKEILDQGARKIGTELKDQPLVQARLMDTMGNVYRSLGLYKAAEPLLEDALKTREKLLGPDHLDTASSLAAVSHLYWNQGRFAEEEPLSKRCLAIREKALGPEDPAVADSLNSLANIYLEQGKFAEAEPLFKRTLAIDEKVLGLDSSETANTLHNLASLYRNQQKYAEAELLQKRSVAIREKTLGPDDPETALGLNNLAGIYMYQRKFAEAEPLFKRFIDYSEKVFGPDHPYTASSLGNLAGVYSEQGKYAEAAPLFKRALAIEEKVLGPDHPNTADTLQSLAIVYFRQNKNAEAEPFFKRAAAIREKVLGPDHPDTAIILNNLAFFYEAQGKYAEAEPLYKRSLAVNEKAWGPDHPATADVLSNLAILYCRQKKFREAEPLFKRTLEIREKAWGQEHPATAKVLEDYARLLRSVKREAEAGELEARAKSIREKLEQKK